MTLKTVLVTGTFYNPDGTPAAGAVGIARLTHYEKDGGIVVPSVVPIVADVDGTFAVPLWPNARGQAGSQYRIEARVGRTLLLNVLATVPDVEGPVALEDIINQAPYPPVDQAQQAVALAQAAALEALGYRNETSADRFATGLDRIATGEDRQATAADREQTGLDRIATQSDRGQTGLDRVQTGLDRIATQSDRGQTGLDRVQTGLDRIATGQDREQTGLDRIATGEDRNAAAGSAVLAQKWATQVDAEVVEGEGYGAKKYALDAAGSAQDAENAASRVPDPAGARDGQILVAGAGSLVYSPSLASVLALSGATPARVVVYETGQRAVNVATDAFGLQTDSGHTWVADPRSGGSPILQYMPEGYLYAHHNPTNHLILSAASGCLIDDYTAPSEYAVHLTYNGISVPSWGRYLIIAQTAGGDRLALQIGNYYLTLQTLVGGTISNLATSGAVANGDVGNMGVVRITAHVHRCHSSFSPITRALDIFLNGVRVLRAPYTSTMQPFADGPCRVGIAIGRSSNIYGFAVEE